MSKTTEQQLIDALRALVKAMESIGLDKSHMLSDRYHNARMALARAEQEAK